MRTQAPKRLGCALPGAARAKSLFTVRAGLQAQARARCTSGLLYKMIKDHLRMYLGAV